MPKNFLCSLLGHNWGLHKYTEQYSGEEFTEVVCKRCKEKTFDNQIFRRLTAVWVKCDVCTHAFMDNQGYIYPIREITRLKPYPHSKTAIQIVFLESVIMLGTFRQDKFYICDTCYKRDFPQ